MQQINLTQKAGLRTFYQCMRELLECCRTSTLIWQNWLIFSTCHYSGYIWSISLLLFDTLVITGNLFMCYDSQKVV